MDYQLLGPACLLAPLAAFFIALVIFRKNHSLAMGTVVLSGIFSAICAILLLSQNSGEALVYARTWITISGVDIPFGILLDGKTLVMGTIVSVITLCVQIYALNYMGHDPGRGRFFAFLALFEWAMLSFVYSPSLMQTFIFWELVGLASFFLIGFWYKKPSAVAAAKKAFIMTRIGDVGLFIGLILLFQYTNSLDILAINAAQLAPGPANLVTLLIFIGIIGKSAQFPLHTWLPDAMEGPTPVSALLHSATMVAAGVFLFARFHPLFMQAELTMDIALYLAAFTAVLSSTMAMVAKDIKKVLAYSSISQLGFMLMALAAGNLFAGYFHLTTHAVFKALLFLCAGSFIHHHGTNDLVALGRDGARKMRITAIGLLVGGAALAGLPGLSGFFSKELVIGSLHGHNIALAAAYLASFMTAYYTFRMVFLIWRPNPNSKAKVIEKPSDDHHESGAAWQINSPILLLTLGAAILGFFGQNLADILGQTMHSPSLAEMAPAILVALSGVFLAFLDFGRQGAAQVGFLTKIPALQKLFENGWYLDVLYNKTFVALALKVSAFLFAFEKKGFDSSADSIGSSTVVVAHTCVKGQTGHLQLYIGIAVATIAIATLYVTLGGLS